MRRSFFDQCKSGLVVLGMLWAATAGAEVTITKFHNDPHGDGTLRRGDTLEWSIFITNLGGTDVTDVRITDFIPAGFDPASFVLVDDGGGIPTLSPPTDPLLEITDIPLGPGCGTCGVRVIFRMTEDGTVPVGSDICNDATLFTAANPGPVGTEPACITIATPMLTVTALKTHSDPDGTLVSGSGEDLTYTIFLTNLGGADVMDVRITDVIPTGLCFLRVDDDGGGTVTLPTPGDPTLIISDIPLGPGCGTCGVPIVFTVEECGCDVDLCNSATIETAANPGPEATDPTTACITITLPPGGCGTGSCLVSTLSPRTGLKGAKSGSADAVFEWDDEADAIEFHLNTVTDKADLVSPGPKQPPIGTGTLQCSATVPTCTDTGAISGPPTLFYQAISACGPLGADEGPL